METRKQSVIFIEKDGDAIARCRRPARIWLPRELGCVVKSTYKCPCHGGVYDREGNVVSGPPPAPLTSVNVRVNPQTSAIEVEL